MYVVLVLKLAQVNGAFQSKFLDDFTVATVAQKVGGCGGDGIPSVEVGIGAMAEVEEEAVHEDKGKEKGDHRDTNGPLRLSCKLKPKQGLPASACEQWWSLMSKTINNKWNPSMNLDSIVNL